MRVFYTLLGLTSFNIFPSTTSFFPLQTASASEQTVSTSSQPHRAALIIIAPRDYENPTLGDDAWHEGISIFQDLTPTTGVDSFEKMAQKYQVLRLPYFTGEIALFTHTKRVGGEAFKVDLYLPPNEVDHWESGIIDIASGYESKGSAEIWGSIATKLELFKMNSHLILKIHIYVNGNYRSSSSWAKVGIHSGNLIALDTR